MVELKDGCVGQQAMVSMQNGDAAVTSSIVSRVPQHGMAELSGVGICSLYQNSQLILDVLRQLQSVQLCQEWRDAVVPRMGGWGGSYPPLFYAEGVSGSGGT